MFAQARADADGHDLLSFFADRLKVQLREQGARHDLVDAVFALPGQDDLVMIVRRIEALAKFLDTDDGKNLLAGTKRAANILRIEETKDKLQYTEPPDAALLSRPRKRSSPRRSRRQARGRSRRSCARILPRRWPRWPSCARIVDAFFDKVTVNVDDVVLRANRLRLLNEIRVATLSVADFSKIEG